MKQIQLTQGKFATVDDEDYEFLSQWKWFAWFRRGAFYSGRNVLAIESGKNKKVCMQMHRVIMGITDTNIGVDHIDHNGLNNQRNNLRICLQSQNTCNKTSAISSTSKYLGVCWHKKRLKWQATIKKYGKQNYLGLFNTEVEAAIAYDNAATKLHGDFANLNFKSKEQCLTQPKYRIA